MKNSVSIYFLFLFLIGSTFFSKNSFAQVNSSPQKTEVIIDKNGVMRWKSSNEEIQGFGVNYTVPFAHAYRSAIKMGIDPLKAIDEDVYHFARLGFDFYRVHVWDTEISDTLGNLIYNEHLHAFDYLLKKLSERNINYVITPIAFWGGGWPEPDFPTPGFSYKYGKENCLTNPDAIKAQENYLFQFMNHINPYTGLAYKDDPNMIAMEISNEPHHREAPEKVTEFVQGMVDAVRKTGFQKPVFYNISHSVHLAKNYFNADIQGGTFQWYPTGLGYQRELEGNILPNVDQYLIPFDDEIKKNRGAKIVYEFDAPDIGKSYPYPAMARSFREAGIQLAAHFSYDPMFLAYANTEYNTHYMNLAYTPNKALSLMICSEVFHRVPMYKSFGRYPDNTSFDDFKINYKQDLAQFNSDEKFYYTNNNIHTPVNQAKLKHIAGVRNSIVIKYDGTGAYFLDKIENGVWRLEVMPDALIVDNPYGRNGLQKEVAVIQWNKRNMKINLEDLGTNFNLYPINAGNTFESKVSNGAFTVSPGVYLLSKTNKNPQQYFSKKINNITLTEFHAPKNSVQKTYLVHKKVATTIEGQPLKISAEVIAPEPIDKVEIITTGYGAGIFEMKKKDGFLYEFTIPVEKIAKGFLNYYIIVHHQNGKTTTYPANQEGFVWDWNFANRNPYTVRVLGKEQPIYLFQAEEDRDYLSWSRWINTLRLVPLAHPNESEYQVNVEQLFKSDNENLNGKVIHDYTVKNYLNPKIDHFRTQLSQKKKLVLKARALNDKTTKMQLALVMSDGSSYGVTIELDKEMKEYEIPLTELQLVKTIPMPRPYPTFLPYYFSNNKNTGFDITKIEGVSFSIGPGISKHELEKKHGIGIVSLKLE